MHYEAAIATSQGARRYQEDAAVVWPAAKSPPPLVAVLADGMGGHAGGATASGLVCKSFLDRFEGASGAVAEKLFASLDAANRSIAEAARAQPSLSGMGATLIGAVFGPAGLEWISVGDSPLYLYRRAEIALLNEDHSLAPALDDLAAKGEITLDQARNDPRRHMLRSAVTGDDLELIDLSAKVLAVEPGDYVLLASDGIHAIDTEEIARVVAGYAADGPESVANAIVRAVLDVKEAHQDNVTVIAVRLSPASETDDVIAG